MIVVKNLSKRYKETLALDNVSVNFRRGVITGLLGRNGAGKTTLINIVTNRIFADSGIYEIDDINGQESYVAQANIICMTEKGAYPLSLRAGELIKHVASFYEDFDMEYALKLSQEFQLDLTKRISGLSTGYGTILKIIVTLASAAKVMILDEPVLGLDAAYRDILYKKLLQRYEQLGNTIILSTHLIEEVAGLLERVVIIKDGKIVEDEAVEKLVSRACVVSGEENKVNAFAKGYKVIGTEKLGGYLAVTIDGNLSDKAKAEAAKAGLNISNAKLQDIFIKLTDRGVKNDK